MIWVPEAVRSGSSLSAYIKNYLLEKGLLAGAVDAHCIDALSDALSLYLEETTDRAGFFVEDGNLLVLASRALRSVGESAAATRMFMLGSGFARPISWVVTANSAGWTLDVARIAEGHHGGLEMIFFRCLHAALEALAEEWHGHGGRVVLVLQGCEAAGVAVLGHPASSRQVQAFVAEVESACRERLCILAQKHGWSGTPQLMRNTVALKGR